jgi:DNA-binding NarL/FixJ family response regulator
MRTRLDSPRASIGLLLMRTRPPDLRSAWSINSCAAAFSSRTTICPEELSPRQLDVLRLLVQGKSTNQIAADLHLAPETVRDYVGSLLKTVGARSRLEATLVALRDGVVSLDLD